MLKARRWCIAMVPRDHAEDHRQASWLELFFDLAFVVAVAQAAIQLGHAFGARDCLGGVFYGVALQHQLHPGKGSTA